MRQFLSTILVLLGNSVVFSETSDIFPLQGLILEMTSADLLKAYPNAKMAFVTKDDDNRLLEGLLFCEVVNNDYWDSALVKVENGITQSLSYIRIKDFDRASKNVGPILKALMDSFGESIDKKVVFHQITQGRVRSPLYIWKHGGNLVVFTHSPVNLYRANDTFICQLTILPDVKTLHLLFDVAADSEVDDVNLFLGQVRDDN